MNLRNRAGVDVWAGREFHSESGQPGKFFDASPRCATISETFGSRTRQGMALFVLTSSRSPWTRPVTCRIWNRVIVASDIAIAVFLKRISGLVGFLDKLLGFVLVSSCVRKFHFSSEQMGILFVP